MKKKRQNTTVGRPEWPKKKSWKDAGQHQGWDENSKLLLHTCRNKMATKCVRTENPEDSVSLNPINSQGSIILNEFYGIFYPGSLWKTSDSQDMITNWGWENGRMPNFKVAFQSPVGCDASIKRDLSVKFKFRNSYWITSKSSYNRKVLSGR